MIKDFSGWGVKRPRGQMTPIRGGQSVRKGGVNRPDTKENNKRKKEILAKARRLSAKKKKMYLYREINDDGEEVVKRPGLKNPITKNPEPFDQEKLVTKLFDSPQKIHKIAGHFITRKKYRFESYDQWYPELARIIHSAKALKGWNSEQVDRTMDYCEKNYTEWTLETIAKKITEVCAK